MDSNTMLDQIQKQADNVAAFGAKLKFVIDDLNIMIDGTNGSNKVSLDDGDADCTIITDGETFMKLKNGDQNPMMAVMMGKVKIKGDMGLAMKLQSLI